MAEIVLLDKWGADGKEIKDCYTGAEIKQLYKDIKKEIASLERQIDYHAQFEDRGHETEKRRERILQLEPYLPRIEQAVSEWFKN